MGTFRDLCLRLKHESNAWLAPWLSDLFVEARRDAISQLATRCLDRTGPAALVAALSARLQPGRGISSRAWHDGLTCRSTSHYGGSSRRSDSPTKGELREPRSCAAHFALGPIVDSSAVR